MEAETCSYSGSVVASLLFRICIYMLLLFDAVKLKLCCVKRVFLLQSGRLPCTLLCSDFP